MKTLPIILGLITANFLYQYIGDSNYLVAVERSYFQVAAILILRAVDYLNGD